MKQITELTFGPAKSGKTKNHVETYPKPCLVLNTELNGLSSVRIPWESKPISALGEVLKIEKDKQPAVTVFDFLPWKGRRIGLGLDPIYSAQMYLDIGRFINQLLDKGDIPFNCIILDSLSGLADTAISAVGALNPKAMNNAMQWAGITGAKIMENICCWYSITCPCIVVLAHEKVDVKEKTDEVRVCPAIPSEARVNIGKIPDQYFYSCVISGKYVLRTKPYGNILGLGQRWSDTMPDVVEHNFKAVYGDWKV